MIEYTDEELVAAWLEFPSDVEVAPGLTATVIVVAEAIRQARRYLREKGRWCLTGADGELDEELAQQAVTRVIARIRSRGPFPHALNGAATVRAYLYKVIGTYVHDLCHRHVPAPRVDGTERADPGDPLPTPSEMAGIEKWIAEELIDHHPTASSDLRERRKDDLKRRLRWLVDENWQAAIGILPGSPGHRVARGGFDQRSFRLQQALRAELTRRRPMLPAEDYALLLRFVEGLINTQSNSAVRTQGETASPVVPRETTAPSDLRGEAEDR